MKKAVVLWILMGLMLGGICNASAQEATVLSVEEQALVVAVGRTVQAKATVAPYAARKAGVSYQSSDESVATVDGRGKIKGVSAGECQITVTSKLDRKSVV